MKNIKAKHILTHINTHRVIYQLIKYINHEINRGCKCKSKTQSSNFASKK